MSRAVIDASALLAFLLDETGADSVADSLDDALIASVNLGEVAQKLIRTGSTRADVAMLVRSLLLHVADVDEALALDAAEMRELGRENGLSQADCICLALGRRERLPILSADTKWAGLKGVFEVDVRLIR